MEHFYRDLQEIFKQHGWSSRRGGKRVSISTHSLRQEHISRELYRLRAGKLVKKEAGVLVSQPRYAVPSPYNLKRKHVDALLTDWCARDLSTAYIHNVLSMLRVFSGWIRKPNLVPATADIMPSTLRKRRQQIATRDKSWTGAGINVSEKIAEIARADAAVGLVLELMWVFGLRLKEASLLCPHLADQGTFIHIGRGTKGGRERVHKISNPAERDVLERVKAFVQDRNSCLIPKGTTYREWQSHMYYVQKIHGISRKLIGTSSHGLRHEYLHNLYEELTGTESPVRGGGQVDSEIDRFARVQIAETAGHARFSVSSCYIGRVIRGVPKMVETPSRTPSVTQCSTADVSTGESK